MMTFQPSLLLGEVIERALEPSAPGTSAPVGRASAEVEHAASA